jgi:hypothetical protein
MIVIGRGDGFPRPIYKIKAKLTRSNPFSENQAELCWLRRVVVEAGNSENHQFVGANMEAPFTAGRWMIRVD